MSPGSDLLVQVRRVQRALAAVHTGRRVLVAVSATLGTLVLVRLLEAVTGGVREWGLAVGAGLLAGATAWWGTRRTPPDLPRTALWLEEQQARHDGGAPDFALTTAVELLAGGVSVPSALGQAARHAVATAPSGRALAAARLRAWRWPALFALVALGLVWHEARHSGARPPEVVGGTAGVPLTAPRDPLPQPLGAWHLRVRPPAYAALPAQSFGDVNSVAVLSGSVVELRGEGTAPSVDVTAADTTLRRYARTTVRADSGGWRVTVLAPAGALSTRLARGGQARLLIIEGRADSVPRVVLEAPARDSVFRDPRGQLPLEASAYDDIGLASALFELTVTSGEGERFTVRTVPLGAQRWAAAAGRREARLRAVLDLTALALQAGDVVHVRAVARDAHPDAAREFGSSETRAFRIARPSEYDSVAVEPAPPPEVDKSLLSQRMLLMLTAKLDTAQRRLARAEVLRESQKLARDQARLRLAVGDVVFQRLSGESEAEHAHSAGDGHDHGVELQGGKLSISTSSTTGMLEEGNDSPVIAINQPLLEAYNAMWDAGRALEQGDPHGAIPPMQRALEAIERSRAATRLYLRGKPPQVIVDVAKVRLAGRDTGQVTTRSSRAALTRREAERDDRLVRAAALVAGTPGAARDSVAVLRAEALGEAPGFAAALAAVLAAFDRGGDVTAAFVQARRVLGNVTRTRATPWSRGGAP